MSERGSGPPLKGPYDPDRIRERVAVAGMTPPDRAPEPLRDALATATRMAESADDHPLRLVEVSQALFVDQLVRPLQQALDAARDSRPVPEQREEPLRVALNAWLNGTGDHVEDEERLVVAAREWLDAARDSRPVGEAVTDWTDDPMKEARRIAAQFPEGLIAWLLQAGPAAVRPVERELDVELLTRAMERALTDEWTIPELADITAAEYRRLSTTQPASTEAREDGSG